MSNTNTEELPAELRIICQNVNKSIDSQTDFLNRISPDEWDIITIQEPGFDFKGDSRASRKWTTIYPLNHTTSEQRSRSLTLVNTSLSTNNWSAIPVDSPDVTGVQLTGESGTIRIFNIYNAQEHNRNLTALECYLKSTERRPQEETSLRDIWIGDFNRHSPMWDEARNTQLFTPQSLRSAQILIDFASRWSMRMALKAGINTLEHTTSKNWTRPDNIWIDAELIDNIIKCDVQPEDRPMCTDHIPLYLTLDISPRRVTPTARYDWRGVDWPSFNDDLQADLDKLPTTVIPNIAQFKIRLKAITNAIDRAIEGHVKKVKPSPYMKRWWSKELAQARDEVRKMGKQAFKKVKSGDFQHAVHESHRKLRNEYVQIIRKAKLEHWIAWLDGIDAKSIWTIHKFIANPAGDSSSTRIPTLKIRQPNGATTSISDNDAKAKALHKSFFPPPPAHIEDHSRYVYPKPCTDFEHITDLQILRAIKKLQPYKAGGDDGHSNLIYTHCHAALIPHLAPVYRATFALKYYPEEWKTSVTVVLRKGDKPDYSIPKAYRPITLLRSIAKILSSAVAEDIVHMAESHNLLSPNQFGGRPGRSTSDALMLATHWIFEKWRKGLVVSGLFLDIAGAFPNTVVPTLLHTMRKRGIPKEITEWLHRRLDGRKTILSFDDYRSQPFEVTNGLDQGDPASAPVFNFCSAELVQPSDDPNETASAFVDDTLFLTAGKTFEETNGKLLDMYAKTGGAKDWAKAQNSTYEVDKFGLVHFSRQREPDPARPGKTRELNRPSITIDGHVIKPAPTFKLLGVILDQELKFKEHVNYVLAKGQKYIGQAKRLAKNRRGVPGPQCTQLVTGVIHAKMFTNAEVWCNPILEPEEGKKKRTGSIGLANKFTGVHRTGLIFITGAMKSTATTSIEAHANLLPIHLAINKVCLQAALRWATLPPKHPLYYEIQRASKPRSGKFVSPLFKLMSAFSIQPKKIETITSVRHTTKWISKIKTHIATDRETAAKEEENDSALTKLYSDGSGFEGGIGAAAILYQRIRGTTVQTTLRYYLGPDTRYTVYEGEVIGQIMGLHLLLKAAKGIGRTSSYVDNQASILSTKSIKPAPGHKLIDLLHLKHDQVMRAHPRTNLTIKWIPSHEEIEGNEEADKQAKQAAAGKGTTNSSNNRLPKELRRDLPRSKAATRMTKIRTIRKQAAQILHKTKQWPNLKLIDPTMPSNKFKKNTSVLNRKQATLLIQLRTGHAPLNKHLYTIKSVDSPVCTACNDAFETVHHFLLRCPATERFRQTLFFTLGRASRSLETLLSNNKALRPLFKFIRWTKRFKATLGDDIEISDEPTK